ncbi:hypothetical protein [Clostridium beijerinckii]|uniref:hypothetical protein n=1 Tax=Clostridium beijerinckii TaxID=1520 RepID=UPI0003D2B34E|nr:hypothetical protein [Clostridium beijerinckii]
MNIPDKVRIGSIDYEVIIEDNTIVLDAVQCKGKINFEFHKIIIDSSIQDKQGQEQTFLHELVHGIVEERSLDLKQDDEETIIDGIAIGLHQVIRDNPDIFLNYIKVGSIEHRILAKHPMCGYLLNEEQIFISFYTEYNFTEYNLCRNKKTRKDFFFKSQRMDPMEIQLIYAEDIFTSFTISVTDFKDNYEILDKHNKNVKGMY